MELSSPKVNTYELNEVESTQEKTPTLEQIKKIGKSFVSRVVEPFSTAQDAEKMTEEQRQHTRILMLEAAINSTRY